MSGHSKWATIKHKKAKTDAARGKVFTKIVKEITTAARIGGPDASGNPRLRLAIDKAKEANMPNDNIKRAIDKATGEGAAAMEEITYEGYGPGGVALLIESLTDNRNRTIGEIRSTLEKNGGNLGTSGSVGWIFKRKGSLVFDKSKFAEGEDSNPRLLNEESFSLEAIDAGAEDIITEENTIEVVTTPEDFEKVRDALKSKGYSPLSSEVTMVPSNTVKLEGEQAKKMLKLMGLLEDLDDVQAVHANFDIPDEIIEQA